MNLAFFPRPTLPSPDGDRGEILGLPAWNRLADNTLYCI